MRRLLLSLALGATEAIQQTAQAVHWLMEPTRLELARGLKHHARAKREAERLERSVVRDIERL